MSKKDIIDILYELNKEISANPLLEFVIIIVLIKKKCRAYKRRLIQIKELQKKNIDLELLNKIIVLIESSTNYISSSKKYLLKLGINHDAFFNKFEEKGIYKIDEIINEIKSDIKNNTNLIEPAKIEVILDFMIKVLNKFNIKNKI